MNLQRVIFGRLYHRTANVELLPWHRDEPPLLLTRAVQARGQPGRVLDLGCGQGVQAVFLARQGYDVVAIDFVPAALAATVSRAEEAGVRVELHECDVVDFRTKVPFDIVLDSGCLHHLPRRRVADYRRRLDEWLAPGGDYVLVHFLHRPRVGWIPKGPRHMSRDQAAALFAPFVLRAYEETSFDVPFPLGRMRAGVYWFTRPVI